jgi:UDP-N-acetylmuramoylalanine--D-glutamate ligase
MKVAILGYGVEGRAASAYWQKLGHEVTVHDANAALLLLDGMSGVIGTNYLDNLDGYDLIVRQQSIHPRVISVSTPVTSVIREFMAKSPAPIIGVTGTKGKGTTSTLIKMILDKAGKRTWLAGNIGVVPLDFLDQITPDDYVILELSSSQLIDVTQSPEVAVGLMIVPEHLNWHTSLDEYYEAKGNIFRFQKPNDVAIYHGRNETSVRLAALSPGHRRPYLIEPGAIVSDGAIRIKDRVICQVDEVGLVGPHNLENVCAAVTATWSITQGDVKATREAITSFTGLPHHIEHIANIAGIGYYDDSFSTTPEAAIAALVSFPQAKIAILGGSDKGIGFDELGQAVEDNNVIHALLIGATAAKIATALDKAGYHHYTIVDWKGMDSLVQTASQLSEPGDIVLMSPGCASFGLFDNYKQRGENFQAAVRKLAELTNAA